MLESRLGEKVRKQAGGEGQEAGRGRRLGSRPGEKARKQAGGAG